MTATSVDCDIAIDGSCRNGNFSVVGTVSAPDEADADVARVAPDVSETPSATVVVSATGITDKGRGTVSALVVVTALTITDEGR